MRVARTNHRFDADVLIFAQPRSHGPGRPDQRRACTGAYEAYARPEVRRNFQSVAAATMKSRHIASDSTESD